MTTSQLRKQAAEICAAFDKAAEIRSRVADFDAASAAKLAAMDRELAELDSRADSDVSALQILLAKREARKRTEARLADERQQLLEQVRKDELAAVESVDLPAFFRTAVALEREKATQAMRPFFENDVRCAGAVSQCDAVNALSYWAATLSHQLPGEAIVRRLRRWVNAEVEHLFRI